MSKTLTQNRLKELLHYDPETGIFTWRVSRRGAKSGSVAGVHDNGYIRIKIDYELYLAHRLTFLYMEGYFPEYHVDHKNRIRDDNRWSNLRHVSRQCNQRNASIAKDNTSGITGVCWHKNNKKWMSRITIEGNHDNIGSFDSLRDAAKARWDAEVKYGFPNCNTTSSAYQYLQENE